MLKKEKKKRSVRGDMQVWVTNKGRGEKKKEGGMGNVP